MKEHPILAAPDVVRAILDGRQTQDRRPLKPQPPQDAWGVGYHDADYSAKRLRNKVSWFVPFAGDLWPCNDSDAIPITWQSGDHLWVREAFAANIPGCEEQGGFSYRADHISPNGDGPTPIKWTPSIHMPRHASRVTLLVKRVWVEQLQDISEESARAEGFADHPKGIVVPYSNPVERHEVTARDWFSDLWNALYKDPALQWDANPWIVATEFERIKP